MVVLLAGMDSMTLLTYGALALVPLVVLIYFALILLTPPPTKVHESELSYLSASTAQPTKLPSTVKDAASLDLTIVVPAFNETQRMPSMLTSALTHLVSLGSPSLPKPRTSEVLIVDDGSVDGTAKAALAMAKAHLKTHGGKLQESGGAAVEIRVVSLVNNLGKGGAVRHGMLHARGRRLLMVDADGASRFEDLERLWEAMDEMIPEGQDESGEAVVVGSRAHLVSTAAVVKRSPLRNLLMYGLHTVLRIVGVGHIHDTQCGFKLFSRGAVRAIFPRQHITNWIFDVEVLLLAKQLDISSREVAINWHEVPGSKLNVVWDSLQMLRDLLVMRGNQLTGRWKVRRDRAKSD